MASVAPVSSFPDEPAGWLGYLARVGRWTIGARWSAARAVAVGRYLASAESLVLEAALKDDLVASIPLALPWPAGAGAPTTYPLPEDGERLLAFLADEDQSRWRPLDVPGGMETASTSPAFDSDVEAARWFGRLPSEPVVRGQALAAAVADAAAPVRASAIRAIADEGLVAEAGALRTLARDVTADPRAATNAAVALWLLGDQPTAKEAFTAIVDRVGHDQFLSLFEVQVSTGDELPATLYGPDPEAW